MKRFSLAVVVFVLAVSGLAFAAQSTDEKRHPAVMDRAMMNHMMGEAKGGQGSGDHMMGMMGMMKMMEQCNAMMASANSSDENKESPKQ